MAYADDFFQLAVALSDLKLSSPRQACLRRAVSTGYYALFHLLVSETTLNYGREELRSELGRAFEHGKMKNASKRIEALLKENSAAGPEASEHLRRVADTFVRVQQMREEADYDVGKEWTQTDVWEQLVHVEEAFESWKAIREEPVAQAYLVSLLGKRRSSE